MTFRLSVDVGGTFTDIVLFNNNEKRIYTTKTPSTISDQSIGLINGIKKIQKEIGLISFKDISYFIHGTTVATNALLERKGAKTALITTEGFRDVFEIARQKRPNLYDFWAKRPKPPIPRYLIFEMSERILYDGSIKKKFDTKRAMEIIKKLEEHCIESVAICFLHSYKNPIHEIKMKRLILKHMPNIYISTSCEVLPEIREYERTCTTAVNAYLMPKVQNYINNLVVKKNEINIKPQIHVMQSNGGIMSSDSASERSVHTVFSGPAGGVLAGIYLSKLVEEPNVITFDIGGTSTDVSLVENYRIKLTTNGEIGTFPIKVPMIEMHTIGTGGGSIAYVDMGGALRVGPESAGSDPGPACYGIGGKYPTVTDANLVLGILDSNNFLGGEQKIFIEKSEKSIEKYISSKLKLSIIESASGILDVVNSNMCGGVKVISTQKGYDLREFSLIAFGGAGSMHAAKLADSLGMKKAIIPLSPGNFSAIGCMLAEIRYDYVRTMIKSVTTVNIVDYCELFIDMKDQAVNDLLKEGYAKQEIIFEGTADIRYSGQAWELSVNVPVEIFSYEDLLQIKKEFEKMHSRVYGYTLKDEDVLIVNLRLSAIGITPKLEFHKERCKTKKVEDGALKGFREVSFENVSRKIPIYSREKLEVGNEVLGPAIIEEYASSTVIPLEKYAYIDIYKNIIIVCK